MAKRGADEQLTRDNALRHGEDEDGKSGPSFASTDIMAKRKILKPRGKRFSFLTPTTDSSPALNLGSEEPVSETTTSNDKFAKLTALNLKFLESVNSASSGNKLADFRPLAKKYLEYYEQVENGKIGDAPSLNPTSLGVVTQKPTPTFSTNKADATEETSKNPFSGVSFGSSYASTKPAPIPAPKSEIAESESESSESEIEEKKPITIQGPTFTMSSKPTTKTSQFSFGPKPVKKPNDSDSESEVEIKGPSFTFNKTIQDPVFKFSATKGTPVEEEPTKSTEAEPKPDNPAFSFSVKEDSKPFGESTGSATSTTSNVPLFSFGSSKPGESINFGQPDVPESFGLTETPKANGFTFGTNGGHKNTFGFKQSLNTATDSTAKDPTSTFQIDSTPKEATKPSFSFGTKTNSNSGGIFSAGTTTQPFGGFGAKSDTDTAPKPFTFGSSTPSSFNFSSTTGSQGGNVPIFQFNSSAATPLISSSTTAITASTNGSVEDGVPEEETGGNFAPIASLGSNKVEKPTTGEEDEVVLYQRKTKLMLFDAEKKDDPYTNLGVGELKVLKSNKTRILIRADGGLRILLNVALLKDVTYSTMGNGSLVRVPTVSEAGKIDTYVLKVKTPADGQLLCDVLNNAKV